MLMSIISSCQNNSSVCVNLKTALHRQVDFLQYYSTQESNQMNILVASQAEMRKDRKDKCVPEVVAHKWNLIIVN